MYHLFYVFIALGVLGVAFRLSSTAIRILAGFTLTFWLGQLFHANLLSMVWGIATSLGCYLNAVLAAEVALCVAGLRAITPRTARRFVAPAGVALFALFDLYSLNLVALPYYAGLTAHRPGGPVTAFHPAATTFADFLTRLAAFKSPLLPPPVLATLWALYAIATLMLVVLAFGAGRQERWAGGYDESDAAAPVEKSGP
jgi:hypothetical protein